MLMKLDSSWLLMAISTVAILSYLFSLGLDGIMKRDGFGPIGNAVVITTSFFLGILTGNYYGIRFESLTDAVFAGLVGAFVIFMLLTLVKGRLNRM